MVLIYQFMLQFFTFFEYFFFRKNGKRRKYKKPKSQVKRSTDEFVNTYGNSLMSGRTDVSTSSGSRKTFLPVGPPRQNLNKSQRS